MVVASGNDWRSRSALRQAGWGDRPWLVLHESAGEEVSSTLQEIADRNKDNMNVRLSAVTDLSTEELAQSPAFILTTVQSTTVRERLRELPGTQWQGDTLQLDKYILGEAADLLVLSHLPNPWNDTLPTHYIIAENEEALLAFVQGPFNGDLRRFFWQNWGYELRSNGDVRVQGYFNDSTWVMDRKVHYEFSDNPHLRYEDGNVAYHCYDGRSIPGDIRADVTLAKERALRFLERDSLPQLKIYGYSTPEFKALRMSSMRQADFNTKDEIVHVLCNENFLGLEWGEQYRPWLHATLGKGAARSLEQGLVLHWVDNLRGHPWQYWVRQLAAAEALPSPALLLNDQAYQDLYPVVGKLAMASWLDYQLQTKGKAEIIHMYKNGDPNRQWAEQYEDWLNYIITNYGTPSIPQKNKVNDNWNGFTLAHEGYRVYNGYGGIRTEQSLRRLQEIGVNAVAIVPYSYMRNPNKATRIDVEAFPGGENDQAVLFAHFAAQSLGQRTMLKPQVWLGSGSWPGDVRFDKEEDWQAFFQYYGDWIMHYALLAEMYGFDAFAIGTEFRYATLERPDDWRHLIRRIRQVYSGVLTYAANWGEECEKLTFWGDLDVIGVNSYYPLHKAETATDEELRVGAERIVEKIARISARNNDQPVWLTEVGFRSATSPWQQPHAEAHRRAAAPIDQARCYEALFAAAQGQPWLQGFFWWKWPSILSYDEDNGRGYMPLGKPSEQVVEKYYRE